MKFKTSDHVQLDYSDVGDGHPVLLLTGIGAYKEIWQPTVTFLVQQGYRVISLDARNQGASQRTFKGQRMSRHALDVEELLTSLNLNEVLGIGNSMGASTLFAYASLFGAGRFKAFVDIDQSPKMIADDNWGFGFKNLTWGNFPEMLNLPFGRSTVTPVTEQLRQMVKQARDKHPYDSARNLAFLTDHAFQDWRDVISQLSIPLLIVVGEKSPYFNPKFAEVTANLAPQGHTAQIKNAGHIVMSEQPALFNECLLQFMRTLM